MSDIETRLRARWDASAALITDAEDPPPVLVRPRRSWHAPLLVAATVLLIAVGVTVAINWRSAREPAASQRSTPAEVTPAPVLEAAQMAIRGQTVHRLDEPIEWVQTTTGHWAALAYGRSPSSEPDNVPLYVIQIQGDFDCNSCKGPGAVRLRGSTIVVLIPLTENQQYGRGFELGNAGYDLSKLGTVHSFRLK